jgi:hypothetical protein
MKWNFEKIQEEANKHTERGEFAVKSKLAYKAAQKRGILNIVCSHMTSKIRFWNDEELVLEALKYNTKSEFRHNSPNCYEYSLRRGILDQICSHMKVTYRHWSIKEIEQEAIKYETKEQFKTGCPSAFYAVYRLNLEDKIFNNMVGNKCWTHETILEIATKCESRSEFKEMNASAYGAARRLKILNEVCSHMKKHKGTSRPEKECRRIFHALFGKEFLKCRPTFLMNENGRPLELDGFCFELKLAFEYDGEQHYFPRYGEHNFNKTKKYDSLKDELCKKEGITLIRIPYTVKNKEEYIKKELINGGITWHHFQS